MQKRFSENLKKLDQHLLNFRNICICNRRKNLDLPHGSLELSNKVIKDKMDNKLSRRKITNIDEEINKLISDLRQKTKSKKIRE